MLQVILIIIIAILFVLIVSSHKENYSYPFTAYFYPDTKSLKNNYRQMSRLPYNMPPVGQNSLGWKSHKKLNREYPTQSELYNLYHPS